MRILPSRAVAYVGLLACGAARADWFVAGYLGGAHTADSDLTASQPDGVHLFRTVSWDSRSFEAPPFYGLQAGTFLSGGTFGLRVDYCHDKVYAHSSLAPTLQRFSLSHGLNSLTVDALLRRRWAWLALYGGAGAGTIVPHVEAVTRTGSVDRYQWGGGVAAKLLMGITLDLLEPLVLFAELRIVYVHVVVGIPDGEARTSYWSRQAAAGVLLRL